MKIIHHAPASHEDRRKSVIEVNLRLSAGVQCSKEKSYTSVCDGSNFN